MDRDARFSHGKLLRDGPLSSGDLKAEIRRSEWLRWRRVGDCVAIPAMGFAERRCRSYQMLRGQGEKAVAAVNQASVCWTMSGKVSHCLR